MSMMDARVDFIMSAVSAALGGKTTTAKFEAVPSEGLGELNILVMPDPYWGSGIVYVDLDAAAGGRRLYCAPVNAVDGFDSFRKLLVRRMTEVGAYNPNVVAIPQGVKR